jgi:RNA polymerase sigma factor (sigma-70 family)
MCFNVLMSAAYRYYNNEEDAASVTNAAFLKIVTKIDQYQNHVPFEAWIKRIALNEIIDEFRKNKKRKEMFVPESEEYEEETNYSDIDYEIEAEYLNNMLRQLPKATRTVFNLFAIDGYSHKEVGEQLGITVETSKWHMKEARKRLKVMLTQEKAEQ